MEKDVASNQEPSMIKMLEAWLYKETDFEAFSRNFYETNGRAFVTSELPVQFQNMSSLFPTNILNAFAPSLKSSETFSSHAGKTHLETRFFLPGRDLFINKFPRYCDPDLHTNLFFEICYVYTGSYETCFYLDGNRERLRLNQGDFLFIPPGGLFQSMVFSSSIILNIGIRQTTFHEAFSDALSQTSCLGKFFWDALSNGGSDVHYMIFHTGTDERIRQRVQELCLSYCCKETLYSRKIMNLQLSLLFLTLMENFSGHANVAATKETTALKDPLPAILHYIELHYVDTSVKDIADTFGFSSDYLGVLFKNAFGTTIGSMILHLKMEKAAELLQESDLSVARIADFLGYKDTTSLIRSFRKYFGRTPAKYRQSPLD